MSEAAKKKTYLGKLYLITLTTSNVLVSSVFNHFFDNLDKNLISVLTPLTASLISYLLVVFVFSRFSSLEEADTNRQLSRIKKMLKDDELPEDAKKKLQERYSELLLKEFD